MSDFDLILVIHEEIKADPNRPVLDQKLDPLDDVAVELLYLEADHLVDSYMEQYRSKYSSQFEKLERFDDLVAEYRKMLRCQVRKFVELSREFLQGGLDGGEGI